MKRRISRLPIVKLALVACSLMIGLALAPVAAQTAASLEGQVTVRSDGAVYLISKSQRHWVATVVISDDELNAYPEAEPIYVGMAPFGGGSAAPAASKPATGAATSTGTANTTTPGSTTPPATTNTSSSSGSSGSTSATTTTTPDPNAQASPVGGSCPADKLVKGATQNGVKYYWEPDRADYAGITPEMCFTAGSYARDAGYKNSKNR
jgi:hypothetical protein